MRCCGRSDGGRGIGFAGRHFRDNWQGEKIRKVLLEPWCGSQQLMSLPLESTLLCRLKKSRTT